MALAGTWLARCQRAAAAALFHQTDIGRLDHPVDRESSRKVEAVSAWPDFDLLVRCRQSNARALRGIRAAIKQTRSVRLLN
jgi:hypothetical protein